MTELNMTYDDVLWKYPKALLLRLIVKSKRHKEGEGISLDDDNYIDMANSDNIEELQRKLQQMSKR